MGCWGVEDERYLRRYAHDGEEERLSVRGHGDSRYQVEQTFSESVSGKLDGFEGNQ